MIKIPIKRKINGKNHLSLEKVKKREEKNIEKKFKKVGEMLFLLMSGSTLIQVYKKVYSKKTVVELALKKAENLTRTGFKKQ